MSYDENRISDLIDGGLIAKEESQKYTQEEKDFLDKCAIAAMQSIVSIVWGDTSINKGINDIASSSYLQAKAMLKARKEALGE